MPICISMPMSTSDARLMMPSHFDVKEEINFSECETHSGCSFDFSESSLSSSPRSTNDSTMAEPETFDSLVQSNLCFLNNVVSMQQQLSVEQYVEILKGAFPAEEPREEEVYLPCKLFVGGLVGETKTKNLKGYFKKFGNVVEAGVVYGKKSKKSRGFGFVEFEKPVTKEFLEMKHLINGIEVTLRAYGDE